MKQYYRYPAIFYFDEDGISIEFPDLPGCLPCADTEDEAFANAKEALGLHLFGMEQDGDEIPEPTPAKDLKMEPGAIVSIIEVFMPTVRDRLNNKVVKKTVTLPAWLNREAEDRRVNFSQILQEGLKTYIRDTQQQGLQK